MPGERGMDTLEIIKESIPEESQNKLIKSQVPDYVNPMLATLTLERFSDEDWLYERKIDGERCFAYKINGKARLITRSHDDVSRYYPEVIRAIESQEQDNFIVDGELTAFRGAEMSYSIYKRRLRSRSPDYTIPIEYYIFDIIHLDGYDLTNLPLIDRKKILYRSLSFDEPLRYSYHIEDHIDRYSFACNRGWEGLIVKRKDSTYVQTRSRKWLKFKCINRQEFIICGYKTPISGIGVSALILGYYKSRYLLYAGKAESGFDRASEMALAGMLSMDVRKNSPFDEPVDEPDAIWVEPRYVAEIKFKRWTHQGRIVNGYYVALRNDKTPDDVVREDLML